MNDQMMHLLLVEDEMAHRELILRAFDPYSDKFFLAVAENLEQARANIAATPPNLVITDLRLPDGLGTELISSTAEVQQYPLVVMTAYGDEKIAVEAIKAGALDYVVKSPQSMADLPRTAERALREWNHIIERKRAERALANRVEIEKINARISTFFLALQPADIDRGINLALQRIGTFADSDRSFVVLLDESGLSSESIHEWCADGIGASLAKRRWISPAAGSEWIENFQPLGYMQIQDLADFPPGERTMAERLLAPDFQSAILVPLSRAHQLAGLIGLESVQGHNHWSEDDVVLLRAVGWMIVNALDRKKTADEIDSLLAAERRQRIQAETLAEVSLALTLQISFKAVLDEILDQAHRIIPYSKAEIILLEHDGLQVARSHGTGLNEEHTFRSDPSLQIKLEELDHQVIQSRQPLLIHSTGEDGDSISPYPGTLWSALAVPIILEERVLGLLHLMSDLPGMYSEDDAHRVKPLANAAAIAIDKAKMIEGLEAQVAARTAEIRAEQQRTSAVLQAAGDPILMADRELVIRFANPALTAMTGYAEEELVGQHLSIFVTDIEQSEQEDSLREVLAQGKLWQREVTGKRMDGGIYEASMVVSSLRDDKDRITGCVASLQDITRFKVLDRAQKKFMHNISHELRTPIANIQLYTDLLQNLREQETAGEFLQVIEEQTRLLAGTVDDILEVTALDTGSLTMFSEPIDLSALIGDLANRFTSRAEAAGLHLIVDPLPPTLPAVKGDQALLKRALEEIIQNAINFLPEEGKVRVKVESHEGEERKWLKIAVSDNGPGIPLEEQGRIFERFYRGSAADAAKTPGMGLGLSLVHSIMAAHSGKVTLESRPGQGGTFILWLRAEETA